MKTLIIFLLMAAVAFGQTQRSTNLVVTDSATINKINAGVDAGASDAYAITLTPALVAYATGATYVFKANTANTGAATLNINGLGAKTIVKVAGGITTALANNDILAGQWVVLIYDGTNMQMQSMLGNASGGGSSSIATLTDAATVTPAVDGFAGGNLLTLSQTTDFLNPTGTPTDGQRYRLRIKSTAARTLTWTNGGSGTQYRGSADLALPGSTSGASLTDYLVFEWNAADSKWDFVGRNFGF